MAKVVGVKLMFVLIEGDPRELVTKVLFELMKTDKRIASLTAFQEWMHDVEEEDVSGVVMEISRIVTREVKRVDGDLIVDVVE